MQVDPFTKTLRSATGYSVGLGSLVALGVASPNPAFSTMVI